MKAIVFFLLSIFLISCIPIKKNGRQIYEKDVQKLQIVSEDDSLPPKRQFFNLPDLSTQRNGKVDIVYTWVNGSEPLFIEHLQQELKKRNKTVSENDRKKGRFNDGDELKYSLRSIEKYFDWYRYIFIVTNGQIPHWLDTSHPRIKLVTHQQIFKNQSHLPTFSSVAIESNLHRIEGLSEEFIYLNDDFLLSDYITKDDFVTEKGEYKIYECWDSPKGEFQEGVGDAYSNSLLYVNQIYDRKYGNHPRKAICHIPHYMKKSVLEELHNTFAEEFEKTSSHKFRAKHDMQFSFSYYHFFKNMKRFPFFSLDPLDTLFLRGKFDLCDRGFDLLSFIETYKTKFLCLQDDLDYDKDTRATIKCMLKFYQTCFPSPSQFEKK